MRVLGFDPGTLKMGVGVVDSESGDLSTPYYACFTASKNDQVPTAPGTFSCLDEKELMVLSKLSQEEFISLIVSILFNLLFSLKIRFSFFSKCQTTFSIIFCIMNNSTKILFIITLCY